MKRAAEPTWGRFPCEQQSTRSLVKERHPTFISTTPPQLLHTRREKMLHSEPKAHPKINSQQPRTRSLATEFILVGMAWHPILSLLQVSSYIFTMDLPAVLFWFTVPPKLDSTLCHWSQTTMERDDSQLSIPTHPKTFFYTLETNIVLPRNLLALLLPPIFQRNTIFHQQQQMTHLLP